MSKKFLNRLLESAGFGGSSNDTKPTKKTDMEAISNNLDSVTTWDQLHSTKKLIINFIKKHKIRSNSPEYKYIIRLYTLRKKVLKSHRLDEGDDDGEPMRFKIRNILRESLEWSDKDESWEGDPNWGSDPNWVQGDAGGSDSGGSDSGDYDSFMGEDDDFSWADGAPYNPIEYEFERNIDIRYIGINKIMTTREDMLEMTKLLNGFGYEWYNGSMPKKPHHKDILWVKRNGKILRGAIEDPLDDEDLIIGFPFENVHINESDELSWMDDIPSTPPRGENELLVGDDIIVFNGGAKDVILFHLVITSVDEYRVEYEVVFNAQMDDDEPVGSLHSISKNDAEDLISSGFWNYDH